MDAETTLSPELLSGLASTRAIRRYTDQPVADEVLSSVLWHATRAPSGSNRQPYRFLVLRDGPRARSARELLGRSFRELWAAKRSADGYDEGSGADADSPKARMAATMQHYVDGVESVPVIVLACYVPYRDRPDLTDGASVYPACQNLLLAARAHGLGGVLTVWHRLVEDDLKALLDIPGPVQVAATITLGHPAGSHGPVRRRPLADMVHDDAWGNPATWAHDPPGTKVLTSRAPRPPTSPTQPGVRPPTNEQEAGNPGGA